MSGAFAIQGPHRAAVGVAGPNGKTLHGRGPNGGAGGTEIHTDNVDYSGRYAFTRGEDGKIDGAAAERSFSGPNLDKDVAVMFDGSTYTRSASGQTASGYSFSNDVTRTADSVKRNVQVTNPEGETFKAATIRIPRVFNG